MPYKNLELKKAYYERSKHRMAARNNARAKVRRASKDVEFLRLEKERQWRYLYKLAPDVYAQMFMPRC